MNRTHTTIGLLLILSACSPPAGTSPTLSILTPTVPPGSPELTLPAMAEPTRTIGTPVPGWENIPIMPGAYEPELADMVYLYSVDTPVEQVEEFYQAKMDVNGWTLTNRRVLDSSPSGGPSTILDYQRDEQLLNVMLVNLPEGSGTTVILTQLGL